MAILRKWRSRALAQRKSEAAEQVEHVMRVLEALYGGK